MHESFVHGRVRASAEDRGVRVLDPKSPGSRPGIGMTTPRLTLAGILMLALFALPHAVEAQQVRVYRVGVVLHGGPYFSSIDGLREGLRELGLQEGEHFVLEVRDSKGDLKSVEAAARSLEAEKVDLIYAMTTSVTLAAKRATKTIPVVFYAGTDPVSVGLVESFRKPGGRPDGRSVSSC